MTFGFFLNTASGNVNLTDMNIPPKTLLSSGGLPLVAGGFPTFGLSYVEADTGGPDNFAGFELLDGSIFYGCSPGTTANKTRMLTNKATNYALIGPAAIPPGYGIEIFSASGNRVLSDNTAVWNVIHKADSIASEYTGSIVVPTDKRIFIFGISCAVTRVNHGTVYYSGIKRVGNTISWFMSTIYMPSASYLGTGSLNLGDRPLSMRLFEIATL